MNFIESLNVDPLKLAPLLFISSFFYVYILKPILILLRAILHYRSFPTIPRHFLLGHLNQLWTNFPFPSKFEDINGKSSYKKVLLSSNLNFYTIFFAHQESENL